MYTIAQFSDRTGISSSALRFYERKGLLLPAARLPNGYRVYAPEQVEEARLINSLRQADVGVADIAQFLDMAPDARREALARWRRELAARLLSLQLAGQYLEGLQPDRPQIHLLRWDEPSQLLWFPATAPLQPLPFAPAVAARTAELERQGAAILSGGFVRTVDVAEGRLLGEVGFRVKPGRRAPAGARVQPVPPILFATLECTLHDEQAAHRVFRFLHEFGFAPSNLSLERYLPGETDRYLLMVAIAGGSDS